jgi:hypothetical protein
MSAKPRRVRPEHLRVTAPDSQTLPALLTGITAGAVAVAADNVASLLVIGRHPGTGPAHDAFAYDPAFTGPRFG